MEFLTSLLATFGTEMTSIAGIVVFIVISPLFVVVTY